LPSFWRPLVTPWILAVAGAPIAGYVEVALRPGPILAAIVAVTLMTGAFGLGAGVPVRRFLAGMADAGTAPRIRLDRYGWIGSRVVHADGPGGVWRMSGQLHRGGVDLQVRPPDRRFPAELGRGFRNAGADMAQRLRSGSASTEQADPPAAAGRDDVTADDVARAPGRADDPESRAQRWRLTRNLAVAAAAAIVARTLLTATVGSDTMAAPAVTVAAGLMGALVAVVTGLLAALVLYTAVPRLPRAVGPNDLWPSCPIICAGLGGAAAGLAAADGAGALAANAALSGLLMVPLGAGLGAIALAGGATAMQRTRGKGIASLAAWLICLAGIHYIYENTHEYPGAFILLGGLVTLFLIWNSENELL